MLTSTKGVMVVGRLVEEAFRVVVEVALVVVVVGWVVVVGVGVVVVVVEVVVVVVGRTVVVLTVVELYQNRKHIMLAGGSNFDISNTADI